MDAAKTFWGMFFILLGGLLLLSTLGYFPWSYWWKLSPLAIVFLGILILLSKPLEKMSKVGKDRGEKDRDKDQDEDQW